MTGLNTNLSDNMASEFSAGQDVGQCHGYTVFIGAILLFQLLNLAVTKIGNPKSVRSDIDPWRWRNLFISWIHAAIVGTWDILCLVLYPEFMNDLIAYNNYFIYLMIPFSTAYFVYDSIDMIVNKKILNNWELSLHHIAVISMFWYNFHARICIGYNVLALMAEINSFFLHTRKLLQMCQVGFDTRLYKGVSYINLVTFLLCRMTSVSRIFYGMYDEGHRVPSFYFVILTMSMIVMAGINIILFWRLFQTDILRTQDKVLKDKTITVNGNNNSNHLKVD
ncbi:TLC domain-containing protein 2-like [Mytilus galloprovincialis]|uniref:TLC domain-containing protein 2-like n=1 Tax=Mytilus galloprovincialis TaxID=29158 RepID=UPI003F7C768A